MADEQTPAAEKPNQSEGDPAQPESPAHGEASENGESKETDWKALALSYKGKVERVNALEQQLQDLQSRQLPPAADADEDLEIAHLQDCQRAVADAQARGERPPTWAVRDLRSYEREQDMAQALRAMFTLPIDQAKEAIKEYATNRSRYPGGVEQAAAELQRKNLEKAQSDKDAEISRLKAELQRVQANRVSPDTVRTSGSEGPTSAPEKQTMTRAQWQERQKTLSADERMAEQRMRSKGLIDVSG